MRFSGRIMVVTGAASGLGLAIARGAEAEGARIVALDRDDAPFADAHRCDVSDEDQVRRALSDLERIFSKWKERKEKEAIVSPPKRRSV